jgi:hypothetical protein
LTTRRTLCLIFSAKEANGVSKDVAWEVHHLFVMDTKTGVIRIVSTVVGLSFGLGVVTATLLLGVAALVL